MAACAHAQAASPFPEVPLDTIPRRSFKTAYLAMAGGAVLLGSSVLLARHADDTYEEYLAETDPETIEALYDEAIRYDWYTRAALVGGNVLIATGLYLRFIKPPPTPGLALDLRPARCALVLHF